jgi:NAD(P)-dependent dehydrogenase (short-subunit alcohol dehydrogenase family)
MRDLKGKTAVITGAASGLGRELALCCAGEGMQVVLTDLNATGLAETARLMEPFEVQTLELVCNVTQAEAVEGMAEAATRVFGPVHLLFNNAGVVTAGPIWSAPLEDWTWMLGVNLMGVVHGVRSFVPRMLAQGGTAHVVNTASLAGLVSPGGLGVYAASKHAVVAVSECLHHDLRAVGSQIGVSVLCPGFVKTGLVDADLQRPTDVSVTNPDGMLAMEQTRAAMLAGRLSAKDIARFTLEAVKADRFYVLPHQKAKSGIESRMRAILDDGTPTNPMSAPKDRP